MPHLHDKDATGVKASMWSHVTSKANRCDRAVHCDKVQAALAELKLHTHQHSVFSTLEARDSRHTVVVQCHC